jgi:hypothetical protein
MSQHPRTAPVTAPAGNRAKVFISNSRKDAALPRCWSGRSPRGFDAFLDKTDIAPGEPWKERFAACWADSRKAPQIPRQSRSVQAQRPDSERSGSSSSPARASPRNLPTARKLGRSRNSVSRGA